MTDLNKYKGIIPAFYACYDAEGEICPERTEQFAEYLIAKGVKGLYVGGSSGECIYQSVADRKATLESVMRVARGRVTVIAHVACNNTRDSRELAAHAEGLGVDAIAAIPPIYFRLPELSIAKYWNEISDAAPNTDFIIYNIPQLAGVALTPALYSYMLENPRVIGVKNSSMPVQDLQIFKALGGDECVVFNGPDEQLAAGLAMGADGGIGGTYAAMPELYLAMEDLMATGQTGAARQIQYEANKIIALLCSGEGHMYAVIKEVLRRMSGLELGSVREPLAACTPNDDALIDRCVAAIKEAVSLYEIAKPAVAEPLL